jgi:hypothetical protein
MFLLFRTIVQQTISNSEALGEAHSFQIMQHQKFTTVYKAKQKGEKIMQLARLLETTGSTIPSRDFRVQYGAAAM